MNGLEYNHLTHVYRCKTCGDEWQAPAEVRIGKTDGWTFAVRHELKCGRCMQLPEHLRGWVERVVFIAVRNALDEHVCDCHGEKEGA